MNISIQPIKAYKDNYIWAIINKYYEAAVIVDPGEANPVTTFLAANNLKLAGILLTHHHWDHINGVIELTADKKIPVYAKMPLSKVTTLVTDNFIITDTEFVKALRLEENKQTAFLPEIKVITIPGHTSDHVAYILPGMVFCGDTLFSCGCGRLFEGTAAEMVSSLARLKALPDDTLVYSGHEYTRQNLFFAQAVSPNSEVVASHLKRVENLLSEGKPSLPSTIGIEKKLNPFLRLDAPEIMASASRHVGYDVSDPVAVFSVLRRWKDMF